MGRLCVGENEVYQSHVEFYGERTTDFVIGAPTMVVRSDAFSL